MKRLLNFFLYLNILIVFLTILCYISPYANPKVLWPISVLAVFYPWFLLANVLFIIFWFIYKFRYAFVSILTILLGINHLNGLIGLSSSGYQTQPDQIQVMSFNAQNLSYIYEDKELRTAHMNTFFEEMNNFENVDILCTQEMGVRSNELMEKRTNFIHIYAPEDVGPVIFSHHPIVNKGQIHSSTSTVNSCVWADININGITYRIYNLHMQSNKITRTAEKVIEDSKLQNKETWNGIKSIITRYRDNANFRIEHAERIRAHMLESPYPVIVAGDFNDVPQSYLYHILSTGMQDSFKAVGSGLGITFSGKIPALRIDYILADQDFRILNHKILKNEFSDHYPITTILNLKPQ